MKSILKLLFAILIASSSAFFVLGENAEVVEARVCPPGEFPHLNGHETTCKNSVQKDTVDENISAIKRYMLTTLKVLIVVSGAISALLITQAGYQYILSEGNPKTVEEAKVKLMRAGVGLLILSLSFVIMNTLTATTGVAW